MRSISVTIVQEGVQRMNGAWGMIREGGVRKSESQLQRTEFGEITQSRLDLGLKPLETVEHKKILWREIDSQYHIFGKSLHRQLQRWPLLYRPTVWHQP